MRGCVAGGSRCVSGNALPNKDIFRWPRYGLSGTTHHAAMAPTKVTFVAIGLLRRSWMPKQNHNNITPNKTEETQLRSNLRGGAAPVHSATASKRREAHGLHCSPHTKTECHQHSHRPMQFYVKSRYHRSTRPRQEYRLMAAKYLGTVLFSHLTPDFNMSTRYHPGFATLYASFSVFLLCL